MQPWQHKVPAPPQGPGWCSPSTSERVGHRGWDPSGYGGCGAVTTSSTSILSSGTSHPTGDVRRAGELHATPSAISPLWLCKSPKITTSGISPGCLTLPEVNPTPRCCFYKKCKGERENPMMNASSFLISLPSFWSFFSLFKEELKLFHQLTSITGKCMTLCSSMSGTSQPPPTTRIPKAGLLQLKTFPCRIFPCKN